MYGVSPEYENAIYGSTRIIRGKAVLNGIELEDDGAIQTISITRPAIGEALMGSALSAKITLTALDPSGQLANVKDGAELSVFLGVENESTGAVEWVPFQTVTCDSVEYDPDAKTCTVSGFDNMALLDRKTFKDAKITYPATLRQIVEKAAAVQGLSVSSQRFFMEDTVYTQASPANLDGDETLRQVIAWAAEAALSNAIIGRDGKIHFISMIPGSPVSTIDAKDYFAFEPNSVFGPINTFVLGRLPQEDNVFREDSNAVAQDGSKELRINDNPFLDLRRDDVIDQYFAKVNGLQVIPYTLDWRGNPAIDPGDTIQVVDSKDKPVTVLFGNSEIEFDGGLRFETALEIKSLTETDKSKATSVRETVRKTQLEVDKANQTITAIVEKTEGYDTQFSKIQQELNKISSTVEQIETQTVYKLYLISTGGDTFKGDAWSTTLQAIVYSASQEITSDLQDSQFKWTRTSDDEKGDSDWNISHSAGAKQISVISSDVPKQATFSCTFCNSDNKPQAVAQITLTIVQDGVNGATGPQGPQGVPGKDGADGKDGKTTYFHVKYSAVASPTSSSQMTETPSEYIGTYVDYTEADSTDPKKYTWARFQGLQGAKGEQGIPGTNGTNGKTSYLHIKYSNDGGKTFTANNGETVGTYIGTCVDYNSADPTSVTAYKWAKIKGEQGATGPQGPAGEDAAIISPTEPADKTKLWCNTKGEPPTLLYWNGNEWVPVNDQSDMIWQIYEDVCSAIDQTADEIRMEVSESTYLKGDVDQLISEVSTKLTQSAEGWEMDFNDFRSWVENANGENQAAFEELRKYIRFISGNIELGDQNNSLKCIISNTKISFTQNGAEVAYISNNKLYITNAEVLDRFTIGNPTSGYFDWVLRSNGNLGMKWRES